MFKRIKLSVRPDGRCSLLWTPAVRPCQSCQTSAEVETGAIQGTRAISTSKGSRPRNSNKTEMSWKTGRQVRERLAAVEHHYGRKNAIFVTITLPTVSRTAFRIVAQRVGKIMDRLNREINRWMGPRDFARVSVWEYQKRGALHAHLVMGAVGMDVMNVEKFRRRLALVWYRILAGYTTECRASFLRGSRGEDYTLDSLMRMDEGTHFVNLQRVKKSVVAYLASYLSESDEGKDTKKKQKLRKKFWPVSTWAQWNRRATAVRDLYVHEEIIGEFPACDEGEVGRSCMDAIKNIPLVEGTGAKQPRNRFVRGYYFLADREPKNWMEDMTGLIKHELRWVSLVLPKDTQGVTQPSAVAGASASMVRPPNQEELGRELSERDGRLQLKQEPRRRAKRAGDELALFGYLVLELAKERAAYLEANPYPEYTQLPLFKDDDPGKKYHPDRRKIRQCHHESDSGSGYLESGRPREQAAPHDSAPGSLHRHLADINDRRKANLEKSLSFSRVGRTLIAVLGGSYWGY